MNSNSSSSTVTGSKDLTNKFPLTIFNGWSNAQAYKYREVDWDQLVEILSNPVTGQDKHNVPYFSIARFEDHRRSLTNLRAVKAIILDIDEGITIDEAKSNLDTSGLKYLIFTSWSHQKPKANSPECDRFRVVIPLSKPLTKSNGDYRVFKALYSYISELYLGGFGDRAANGPERLNGWYIAQPNKTHKVFSNEAGKGIIFDPESIEISTPNYSSESYTPPEPSSRLAVCSMLDRISPNINYADWCRVAWGIHENFYGDPEDIAFGEALFDLWSSEGDSYDGKASRKYYEFNPSRSSLARHTTIRSVKGMARDSGWYKGLIYKPSSLAEKLRTQGWTVDDQLPKRKEQTGGDIENHNTDKPSTSIPTQANLSKGDLDEYI